MMTYTGEYPKEAPFTISELEEIYPTASGRSKEDPAYKEKAMEATEKAAKRRTWVSCSLGSYHFRICQ